MELGIFQKKESDGSARLLHAPQFPNCLLFILKNVFKMSLPRDNILSSKTTKYIFQKYPNEKRILVYLKIFYSLNT